MEDNRLANAVQQVLPIGCIVKKSNTLVRTKILHTNGTVNHNRIIAALISTIKTGDEDFNKTHVIHIKSLIPEQTGINYYKNIKTICREVADTKVEIEGIDEDGEQAFGFYNYFTSVEYQKGYVTARFSPLLKPYLLQLRERFTEYYLIEYLSLPSIYSQRLYEILMSWSGLLNKPIKFDINELHELLGTPESLRENYKDFRVRVLEKALKHIEKHTELRFAYKPLKKGGEKSRTGKVYAIEFIIKNVAKIKHEKKEQQQIEQQKQQQVQQSFAELQQYIDNIDNTDKLARNRLWWDLFIKENQPKDFVLPPVPPVFRHLCQTMQHDKNFNLWFSGINCYIDTNGELIFDITEHNENSFNQQVAYIKTHFIKYIEEAIQQISPGLQYKFTHLAIHNMMYNYVLKNRLDKQKNSETVFDLLDKRPLSEQFELLKKYYPRESSDYSGAYKAFCLLRKKNELPSFKQLVLLINKFKEKPEWMKDGGKWIPSLKKWLELKPWATVADESNKIYREWED